MEEAVSENNYEFHSDHSVIREPNIIVAGITGAGKSTVSTIIKNNTGAMVIDADQLARQLLVPGEKYFNDVTIDI